MVMFFYSSQTFHEVISFLYSFVTKMQEGDYDAEPKEESKVWYLTFITVQLVKRVRQVFWPIVEFANCKAKESIHDSPL